MSAEDVAEKLPEQVTIGASGFTPAGYPKVIPQAFAQRINQSKNPENFSINLYTGASTGDELDGVLARTGRMKLRIPYQSHPDLRKLINQGKLNFIDMHLREGPPEDHPTRIGARRRKFFFPILLPKMKDFD
jgi:acetyl-CoA hydrolase/succinyl-CoA:acetate CoA-transferase